MRSWSSRRRPSCAARTSSPHVGICRWTFVGYVAGHSRGFVVPRSQAEGPFEGRIAGFPSLEIRSPSVALYDHVCIDSFFACLDQALARREPFFIVHETHKSPHVDDGRRKQFMELLEQRRKEIERYVVAYAAVVSSPLERGLITAFIWFCKLPMPMRSFANRTEADAWLWARYDEIVQRQQFALSAE